MLLLTRISILIVFFSSLAWAQDPPPPPASDDLIKEFESKVNPDVYHREQPPANLPVTVAISMYAISITPVSHKRMEFDIDMYFRQKWIDPRLANLSDKLYLSGNVAEKIWRPDTFVSNAGKLTDHSNYDTFSDGNQFLRIETNGTVFYSHRLTATVTCGDGKSIKFFPADKPRCHLTIESYGHNMDTIVYKFAEVAKPVQVTDESVPIGFRLDGIDYRTEVIPLSTGKYSQIIMEFRLTRQCCYYVFTVYAPAFLLVVLSWMAFCLDPERHPHGRMSVGILTIVGLLVMLIGAQVALPSFYTLRAIDVYLFVCFFMALAAMMVSAHGPGNTKSYQVEQCQVVNGSTCKRWPKILFPIIFILFNIFYTITLAFCTGA